MRKVIFYFALVAVLAVGLAVGTAQKRPWPPAVGQCFSDDAFQRIASDAKFRDNQSQNVTLMFKSRLYHGGWHPPEEIGTGFVFAKRYIQGEYSPEFCYIGEQVVAITHYR